ncbi:hypothetical protein [Clostridium algidicarnis]|uniref:hypothetical protein n=1 Tax=Clostridium algidicarnis TaxID=37659 RepID=UPI001C0DB1CD|nr:hypothetical protein [Clostridium algidicarnis]MBU3209046.1 hypothetical protein [Clostridium algidicarnis]MBU3228768.1 hypothetical protein [Clostridium algidicarnis]MBU3252312.1 hypothetical protein [Clostridium algidicarnis]
MKKLYYKKFLVVTSMIVLFFIALIFSMFVIRRLLDAQTPNLDVLIQNGKDAEFNLKLLGLTLQNVLFTISNDGSFVISYNNSTLFYLFPLIFAIVITILLGKIINKIKMYTSNWKL